MQTIVRISCVANFGHFNMFGDIHRQEVKFGLLVMLNNNVFWFVMLFNYNFRLLIRGRGLKVEFRFMLDCCHFFNVVGFFIMV